MTDFSAVPFLLRSDSSCQIRSLLAKRYERNYAWVKKRFICFFGIRLKTGTICLIKDILEVLEAKSVKAFEKAKQQLSTEEIENTRLRRALDYYKMNWNDVLHPGIIAIACEAVGGNEGQSILMQVPMLFLSAAADLHDDILDESQMKNGKLTVAGKYGTEVALLVGDQMLFKAMKALYTSSKTIATEKMDSIISAIDEAFVEVGEAHTVEMGFKEKPASNPKSYFRLLERKSAILEAHTRIGALVGDGDEREIENLTRYGRILGTLMTIRDEFIDLFEPKELADRLKNGCLPLPMIYAYQNPLVKKKVMAILSKPEISKKDADIVVDLVFEDRHVKRLRDEMAELSTKALELTTGLCKRKNLELAVNALLDDL